LNNFKANQEADKVDKNKMLVENVVEETIEEGDV